MAAWKDLETRLAQGLALHPDLHVASIYRGTKLPGWLQTPLTQVEQTAVGRVPVLVLNVKGRRVQQTLCLLALGDLEQLLQAAARPARDVPGTQPSGRQA